MRSLGWGTLVLGTVSLAGTGLGCGAGQTADGTNTAQTSGGTNTVESSGGAKPLPTFGGAKTNPPGDKPAPETNTWVYGEWQRCASDNGGNESYVRRGTSREGCKDDKEVWVFTDKGKWTHGSESGSFTLGLTQSSCDLPDKAVGVYGTPDFFILVWESDNRIRMTAPCLK